MFQSSSASGAAPTNDHQGHLLLVTGDLVSVQNTSLISAGKTAEARFTCALLLSSHREFAQLVRFHRSDIYTTRDSGLD